MRRTVSEQPPQSLSGFLINIPTVAI
jgi:hypothetical protein